VDDRLRSLIDQIHATPRQLCLALAGAGSQALAWMLAVPGGSRTLLEALIPYNRLALDDFLGFSPAQYASAGTALALAARAAARAEELQGDGELPAALAGLACAAAIATEPPRRGSHRAAVARWDAEGFAIYELVMAKGRRDREGEEDLVSRLVLRAVAEVMGLEAPGICAPDADEQLQESYAPLRREAERLLAGELPLLLLTPDGVLGDQAGDTRLLLPGSFNPLHRGHRELAEVAEQIVGAPACFEIAARNADKPALPADALVARVRQLAGWAPVALTAAPLFVQKARLFPGATFVVGADTAARLVEPRYYGDEPAMLAAFAEIHQHGCRFLVAGRLVDGRFLTLDDLALPQPLRDLFAAIPSARFREDISSSEIRANPVRAT
jgi:hypothetical protein